MLSLKKFFFNKLQATLMCSQVEAIREALLLNPGLSQSVHLCPVMSQNPGADQSRRLSACVIWKLGLIHPARQWQNQKQMDLPGRPVVKTLHFQFRECGFDPWFRDLRSHMQCSQKKKKRQKQRTQHYMFSLCIYINKIYVFIYFRLCWVLLLCRLFSACGQWGYSSCGAWAFHCDGFFCCRVQALEHRLNSCDTQFLLLLDMWNLPEPGIEPQSPALAGEFFTTKPPGKHIMCFLVHYIHLLKRK